jgi:hypothetical protein
MEGTEVVFNHETRMVNTEAMKRTSAREEAGVVKERSGEASKRRTAAREEAVVMKEMSREASRRRKRRLEAREMEAAPWLRIRAC